MSLYCVPYVTDFFVRKDYSRLGIEINSLTCIIHWVYYKGLKEDYMNKYEQMVEAHKKIYLTIDEIKKSTNNIENKATGIAKSINQLAGLLRIHLLNEDKYLYPAMNNSSDDKLKSMSKEFQTEMGSLGDKFTEFKSKYNTSSKLLDNISVAEREINGMCDQIITRMNKEDNKLYPLAKNVMK